ncbi:hypothetical protein SAMN05428950_101935 [Sphingomonas sp. OV641]|nr:hypothetical protein SAMN05428950_101935 [Sphingomonas sp. OV641]
MQARTCSPGRLVDWIGLNDACGCYVPIHGLIRRKMYPAQKNKR